MLEWILALSGLGLFLLILPRLLARAKAGSRKHGGGFVVALGMIFASAFDPARSAAVEEIDRRKDTEADEEESGGPPD